MSIVKEKPQTLSAKAYEIIEELIATVKLPPGTIFSEGELAARIGIGRTPLREALLRLSREHLIEMMPRRGVRVTDINLTDQLALLEVRRVLDRVIAEKAAERATKGERKRLLEISERIIAAAKKKDLSDYMKLDAEFDRIIAEASRNRFCYPAVLPLHALCRRFWAYHHLKGDPIRAAKLHSTAMKAIARGNSAAAGKASDKLIDYLEEFTRSSMDLYSQRA
jgi:DNA-binding GntR family transcriptional regulator